LAYSAVTEYAEAALSSLSLLETIDSFIDLFLAIYSSIFLQSIEVILIDSCQKLTANFPLSIAF